MTWNPLFGKPPPKAKPTKLKPVGNLKKTAAPVVKPKPAFAVPWDETLYPGGRTQVLYLVPHGYDRSWAIEYVAQSIKTHWGKYE